MSKLKTKRLSLLLALVMILSIFPMSAMAAQLSEEPPVFTGSNPEHLRALLAEGDAIVATPGNLGIFLHHSQFVVPAGRTLIVRTRLNIQGAAELVINGTLIVEEGGRVNNQGGPYGGTITVAPGGEFVNNGHVENVTNSTVMNRGTIINNARFEVRANTTLCYCDGYILGTTPLNIHRYAILCPVEAPGDYVVNAAGATFLRVANVGGNVWEVTFTASVTLANGEVETRTYTFRFTGNNANQSGRYTFGAGHDLEGLSIQYDIRGGGSNIVMFRFV